MLCQIVVGPHFQNFTLHCCFFTWRRASENVDRISNNSKKKIVFVFNIFKGFTWNKMCSLVRWKAKNEKKLKKKWFPFDQVKTVLPILAYFQIFNKIFIFKVCGIFKNENFAEGAKIATKKWKSLHPTGEATILSSGGGGKPELWTDVWVGLYGGGGRLVTMKYGDFAASFYLVYSI